MTSLNPVKRIGVQLTESMRYHLGMASKDAGPRRAPARQVCIPSPEQRMRQYPHELSGRMRHRVVIAMALACEPQLLIADEQTTALDVTVQKAILDLIDPALERNMSLILITHDLGVAEGAARPLIGVMYAGRLHGAVVVEGSCSTTCGTPTPRPCSSRSRARACGPYLDCIRSRAERPTCSILRGRPRLAGALQVRPA